MSDVTVTVPESQIDRDEVENLIRAGKFSIKQYAAQIGVKQSDLRQWIVLNFGADNLEFRRGRSGGVFFRKES